MKRTTNFHEFIHPVSAWRIKMPWRYHQSTTTIRSIIVFHKWFYETIKLKQTSYLSNFKDDEGQFWQFCLAIIIYSANWPKCPSCRFLNSCKCSHRVWTAIHFGGFFGAQECDPLLISRANPDGSFHPPWPMIIGAPSRPYLATLNRITVQGIYTRARPPMRVVVGGGGVGWICIQWVPPLRS